MKLLEVAYRNGSYFVIDRKVHDYFLTRLVYALDFNEMEYSAYSTALEIIEHLEKQEQAQ